MYGNFFNIKTQILQYVQQDAEELFQGLSTMLWSVGKATSVPAMSTCSIK